MPFRSQLFVTAGALVLLPTSAACAAEQDGGTLDEIVVTAEKSNRSLRETASSVTVITDEAAERMGVYGTNELLDRMTNLVNIKPGNAAPTVRGIDGTGPAQGSDAFFAGTRPRLNYQLDGRTLGFNESIFQNGTLWDIGQVEVYRGPQSTLQGRNAIAGTIAIHTADPTFDWGGRARALVGNQDERQVSGALSGPIAPDVLAFRLSADWRRSQAYVDFTPYPEEAHPGRFQNLTLRGKLLFTPTPDVRSLLTVSYVDGRAPQSEYVLGPNYGQKIPQSPRSRCSARATRRESPTRAGESAILSLCRPICRRRISGPIAMRRPPPAMPGSTAGNMSRNPSSGCGRPTAGSAASSQPISSGRTRARRSTSMAVARSATAPGPPPLSASSPASSPTR
jgi:outer membrane receptor protein involved in Fe transport